MSFIEYRSGVRDLERRQSELRHRTLDVRGTPPDPLRLVEVRDRYDAAYQSLGARGAPQPLGSESPYSYRRRLASGLQKFSPAWRDANLFDLGVDALSAAEPQIIADTAAAVADRTRGNPDGSLREITRSQNGHGITEFAGNPLVWMAGFMAPGKAVKRFQHPNGAPIRIQRRTVTIK